MTDGRDDLTALRLTLRASGYFPVPVSGPDMNVPSAGKRPLMAKWQTRCLDASIEEVARWPRVEPGSTNTGLLTGALTGVDIDILNPVLAERIEDLAISSLGPTPLRRIGRAPKVLLCYRPALAIDKLQTPALHFTEDPLEKPTRVEVLGRGQQFVAFGVHPETRQPYAWPDGSPLTVPFADVPEVEPASLRQFLADAEELIREAGAATRADRRRAETKREAEGRRASGFKAGERPDQRTVADALEHIPNDLDYDEWVRIGFALYAALGEGGRDLWEAWSASSPRNDPALTARKWSTFAQGRTVTAATLFWHAARNGWRNAEARKRSGRRDAHQAAAGAPGSGPSDDGLRAAGSNLGEDGADEDGVILPVIRVSGGNLPRAVAATERAILAADAPIYTRAGTLVRPVVDTVPAADGRTTTTVRFRTMCPPSMTDHAARVARFQRYDKRSEDWVDVNPPMDVIAALLARDGEWSLPPVAGIITTPTLRPDGSILDRPGYDPATRLLLVEDAELRMPEIAEHPTRDDARRALDLLIELLDGFPFVGPLDRAVALSGLMIGVLRGAMDVAPLHAIRAHTPGDGKSYLVDLISLVATGRRCPVITAGKTEEESEKRLGSMLRDASAIVSLDNVNGELGGDMLCQMTERPVVRIRILGKTETPELECRSAVFATGNNLTLVGDMTRRTILCSLNSGVERPELREFTFRPDERIRADRGAYVAAVLTIARAYIAAGSPKVCGTIGSYGQWSDRVRAPLIWLGESDPVKTMEQTREEDPELAAIRELFGHWQKHLAWTPRFTTNAIIQVACEREHGGTFAGPGEFRAPEFRDLLLRQAGEGGAINSRKLGKWLTRISGRVVNGQMLEAKSDASNGNRFSLHQCHSDEVASAA
ncbi:hypothetical protein FPV16_25555 [Methylobacterium sp. W2]|uniref:PriCT-2 domain-containing protein n=1 Tax=Methylobacterium sp. W2 TaxID=2598107 RepID=UPI001D0C3E83|nr:PriCT-2 domain-containing protein [Methylobacterium sp. W2]MCC0809525.1 hypothetical protein [Methylobacterium sp. W2]